MPPPGWAPPPYGVQKPPPGPNAGRARIGVGGVLAVIGAVVLALSIAWLVRSNSRIEGDAVAKGTLVAGEPPAEVTFDVPDGGRRAYTVYVLSGEDDGRRDLVVEGTSCSVDLPGGDVAQFSGFDQDFSAALGSSASVGDFRSRAGQVRLSCELDGVASRVARSLGGGVDFVVTPGRPSSVLIGILAAFAGGILAAGGMGLFVWGMVVRSKRVKT